MPFPLTLLSIGQENGQWSKLMFSNFILLHKGVQWTNAKLHLHIPICLTYQTHIKQTYHANLVDYTTQALQQVYISACFINIRCLPKPWTHGSRRLGARSHTKTWNPNAKKQKWLNRCFWFPFFGGIGGDIYIYITQLAGKIPLIYHLFLLPIGVIICYFMLPIPPIKGTRKPIDMNLSLKSGTQMTLVLIGKGLVLEGLEDKQVFQVYKFSSSYGIATMH